MKKLILILGLAAIIIQSCTYYKEVSFYNNESVKRITNINSPVKVFLKDGSVLLLKNGFRVNNGYLRGVGIKYSFDKQTEQNLIAAYTKVLYTTDGKYYKCDIIDSTSENLRIRITDAASTGTLKEIPKNKIKKIANAIFTGENGIFPGEFINEIPLDSVAAMCSYKITDDNSAFGADVLLLSTGSLLTTLAVVCLANPKICFGSCPTLYSQDGSEYKLEAELFSHSIAKTLEDDDMDLLAVKPESDSAVRMKLTNEALETHYIDKFQVLDVKHKRGKVIFPLGSNDLISVGGITQPSSVSNSRGKDVLSDVIRADNNYYRSDSLMAAELKNKFYFDNLNIKAKLPEGKKDAVLIIRYRNTLMSTILFYDMVLGSQGIKAVNWLNKMDEDKIYSAQFRFIYGAFSGISVYSGNLKTGSFGDAGPINWKYASLRIPAGDDGNIDARLEFVPDNFMIDYIAIGTEDSSEYSITHALPSEVKYLGKDVTEKFIKLTSQDDSEYLVTNPSESYSLTYNISSNDGYEHTLLVSSNGYYTEWLRGSWINDTKNPYTFNLYDIDGTVKELASRWSSDRGLLESEFFKSRIKIREK